MPIEKAFHSLDKIFITAGAANLCRLDNAVGSLPILIFPEVFSPVLHRVTQKAMTRQERIASPRQMRFRAAPGIVLRGRNEAAPHRVHLHIPNRRVKVPLIEGAGEKTALPQVARCIAFAVKILGIEHVHRIESSGQRILVAGNANNMDMIRHEAPSPYIKTVLGRKHGEGLQILRIIVLFRENGLPVIPPLRDVVGITNCNCSSYSRHN